MRTTEQRVGDITLVLVAVAALSFVARVAAAASAGGGGFWTFLAFSGGSGVVFAFAASCTYGWMEEARRVYAKWGVVAVFVCSGIAMLGGIVFGGGSFGSQGSTIYLDDAASLLMIAGGLTLLAGLAPGLPRPVADDA